MEYEVVYETRHSGEPLYLCLSYRPWKDGPRKLAGYWTPARERGEVFDSPAQARHAIERYVRADMRHHAKVRRVEDEHGDR